MSSATTATARVTERRPDAGSHHHHPGVPGSTKLVLTRRACVHCDGSGQRLITDPNGDRRLVTCKCVLRDAFRVCLNCWHGANQAAGWLRYDRGRHGPSFSRPREEYLADLVLTAHRTLTPRDFMVFRLHHIQRLPWHHVCPIVGLSRGNFFHAVYGIEELLGERFRNMRPYRLYPPRDYFTVTSIQ